MLLIDASNIGGGGTVLLQYLAERLRQRSLKHFILVSPRVDVSLSEHQVIAGATPISRRRRVALANLVHDLRPQKILCFGNVPPPFHIPKVKVFTYFHNALLIPGLVPARFDLRNQVGFKLLRFCIKRFGAHTAEWVFQTQYVCEMFASSLASKGFKGVVFPFYPPFQTAQQGMSDIASDFIFVSNYSLHKNHANLLRAVIECARRDVFPTLVLTINENCSPQIHDLSRQCEAVGARVIFAGSVSHEKSLELTRSSRFAIFPSLIETLGLGALEAIANGKDLLISDRPWVDAVCNSSLRFDPASPTSIADAMQTALRAQTLTPSVIKVNDRIDELIDHMYHV